MMKRSLPIVLLLLLFFTSTALAQNRDRLDITQPPNYGSATLQTGFSPDPYIVADVVTGGSVDVSYLGGDCRGFVTRAPDFQVRWTGDDSRILRFFFFGSGNTTMVINDPNGRWHCVDDAFDSQHPAITFDNPVRGRYDVWIGSFRADANVPGTLYITQNSALNPLTLQQFTATPTPTQRPTNTPAPSLPTPTPIIPTQVAVTTPIPGQTLDFSLPSQHGIAELQSGFLPDPHTAQVTGGGPVAASYLDGCVGYADAAPDYSLRYTGGGRLPLRIFFVGQGDSTLIINAPDGTWHCNDDSFGTLHPTVDFASPTDGRYDIWVGAFNSSGVVPGTLHITERSDINPATEVGGGRLDPALPPEMETVTLEAGFRPDPYTVALVSGGPVYMAYVGATGCRGYGPEAPHINLEWDPGTTREFLRIFFVSENDATMVIQGPDGEWYCNDDSFGTLHPALDFENAQAGTYHIWAGSYSEFGAADGMLYITQDSRIDTSTVPVPPNTHVSGGGGGMIDASLTPLNGQTSLRTGFTPDPLQVVMSQVGGDIAAFTLSLPGFCTGYVTAAPTYVLDWGASSDRLDLRIFFVGQNDTTMIIQGPDGQWHCNDDSFGTLHPSLDFQNAPVGRYAIWVGTYAPTPTAGSLYITELTATVNPSTVSP